MSAAMSRLHSLGIADLSPGVLQQLISKHPTRDHSVPDALPTPAAPPVDPIELADVFRALRRRAGTGPSGRRNEYLRALVANFGDSHADRVIPMYNDFATRAVNAQYPRWFYAAWAAASMMPLVKGQRTEAEIAAGRDPDCRPVAIGEVDLRAIGRAVTGIIFRFFTHHIRLKMRSYFPSLVCKKTEDYAQVRFMLISYKSRPPIVSGCVHLSVTVSMLRQVTTAALNSAFRG